MIDNNGLLHRYLLIGYDQYRDIDGMGVPDQSEALRIVADNDYPYMTWTALYDSQEEAGKPLITGLELEALVRGYRESRAADERHERSLGVTG